MDTATVKQIGWIFKERKDLFDRLNLRYQKKRSKNVFELIRKKS